MRSRFLLAQLAFAQRSRSLIANSPNLMTMLALAVLLLPGNARATDTGADTPDALKVGRQIYQEKCASCHGADGQGASDGEGYDDPLQGEETVASLARIIEQTMPEENPEQCVGDQARQVAQFIYDEFYSLAARRRKGLAPLPKIELSHLTVEQHRNALADLVGHFAPKVAPTQESEPGLRGEYYQSRGMSKADSQRLTRVDAKIDFDFGAGSPHADIAADQFTIIWTGSLYVRHTGIHEFRIATENGARLYVNQDSPDVRQRLRDDSSVIGQDALIDAWVSVGQLREESARLFLLGGRTYPVRLEFFKYKDKSSSIKLEWRQPDGVWAVFDHNHLRTAKSARTFVAQTPFPPDDSSFGYPRGTAISAEWYAAVNQAAIETANEVINRLPVMSDVDHEAKDRAAALREFAQRFAAHAFRRPLSEVERNRIGDLFAQQSDNPESALRRSILMTLESPFFLYTNLDLLAEPTESANNDTNDGESNAQLVNTQSVNAQPVNAQSGSMAGWQRASHLALALWDSIPSGELMKAAESGKLETEEQVEAAARKMLADPRTKAKIAGFFRHWLEIEYRDLAKDKELFPEFDEQVISDLRFSLEVFLDQVVWSKKSDYRDLLQADYLVLNGRLQKIYQQDPPPKVASATDVTDFRQFDFPDQMRAGVLTHPYLLSAFAYHNNTSPIHRGVFLTRNIVGRALKPPTEAVTFKDDEFSPDLTMREKITQLTKAPACMGCHSVINPLGFALENFDAVGRWRTQDNAKPVNTKTTYVTADGQTVEFASAVDIAKYAVASKDAHRAFVAQVFKHLIRQDPAAFGADTLEELTNAFEQNDFNIQDLLVRIAVRTTRYPTQNAADTPALASRESHEPRP